MHTGYGSMESARLTGKHDVFCYLEKPSTLEDLIKVISDAAEERVNALARQRGLTHLRVRGRTKVRCILLLHALAHNLMRTVTLAPQLLGYGGGASGQPVMAT